MRVMKIAGVAKQTLKKFTYSTLALVVGASSLAVATPLFLTQTAYAATLDVCPSSCSYSTIQAAVDAATSGDTISVAAGNYSGAVTINKNLTLQGAQAGVDARTRDAGGTADSQESIISTNGIGITINSGTVTIDGFKFTTSGDGITNVSGSVNRIQNNIFSGISGAHAAEGQFANTTIQYNRVENSEYGFEANSISSGNNSVTIDSNKFVNTSQYDVAFLHGGTGIVISNNQRTDGAGNFIALFGTASGAQISDNTVSNISSSVVYVGSSGTSLTISGNTFSGNTSKAINVAGSANSGITISDNDLSDNNYGIYVGSGTLSDTLTASSNNLSGNSTLAVSNDAASGGSVNAALNYWGGDPTSLVSGTVSFTPYFTNADMTIRSDAKVLPDDSGNATLDSSTPQVIVTDSSQPLTLTVTNGTTNASIDVSSLVSNGTTTSTATLPQTTINSNVANVSIPASTVVTANDPSWDGVINAPTVLTNTSVPVTTPSGYTTTLGTVIDLGSSSADLSFSNAVRLLIPGQANQLVGFVKDGAFTQITTVCNSDVQATVDAQLPTDGACYANVGSDMVIWTKHFTQFVTYTQASTASSSSSSSTSSGSSVVTASKKTSSSQTASASSGSSSEQVLGTATSTPNSAVSSTSTTKPTVASVATPKSGKILGVEWYLWIIAIAALAVAGYSANYIRSAGPSSKK